MMSMGELGAAGFDAVEVRDLGPEVAAEDVVRELHRPVGPLERHPVPPLVRSLPLVEDVHRDVPPDPALVDELGGDAPGEVMHLQGAPADSPHVGARVAGEQAERLRLHRGVGVTAEGDVVAVTGGCHPLPAGVAFHRNAGGADHLVVPDLQRHVVAAELAEELALRHERVVAPAAGVEHRDARIPLREVVLASCTTLAARGGGEPRVPVHQHRGRGARCERLRERQRHHGGVRRAGVVGLDGDPVDRHAAEALVGVLLRP
jgi:hypothetical protein